MFSDLDNDEMIVSCGDWDVKQRIETRDHQVSTPEHF
jgi:hypothetical protein